MGPWASETGQIALWIGGGWLFVVPNEGVRVRNKFIRRQSLYISAQWTNAPAVSNPAGGTVVDGEARAALVAILQYFRLIGILAT